MSNLEKEKHPHYQSRETTDKNCKTKNLNIHDLLALGWATNVMDMFKFVTALNPNASGSTLR
jgi:hypothetical protein